eukprot:767149-Hanusia_phi.AAC.3
MQESRQDTNCILLLSSCMRGAYKVLSLYGLCGCSYVDLQPLGTPREREKQLIRCWPTAGAFDDRQTGENKKGICQDIRRQLKNGWHNCKWPPCTELVFLLSSKTPSAVLVRRNC